MSTQDLRAAAIAAREAAEAADRRHTEHWAACTACQQGSQCDQGKQLWRNLVDASRAAWDACEEYAPTGSWVTYNGSITGLHGSGWKVLGPTPGRPGTYRIYAEDIDKVLSGVRPESITPQEPATGAAPAREEVTR